MNIIYKLFILIGFCCSVEMKATPIFEINQDSYNRSLSNYLYYYEDKDHSSEINQFLSEGNIQVFSSIKDEVPNFGYSSSIFWFKLKLKREKDLDKKLYFSIQNSNIDKLEIYEVFLNESNKNEIRLTSLGDQYPISSRIFFNREFIFAPEINEVKYQEIYFKIETTSSMIFPLYLIDEESLSKDILNREIIHGIYYGVVLAIFLYNLIVFISIKDLTFFYYILYILGFGFLQAVEHGHAFLYLWPESPNWQRIAFPFFMGITISFGSLFSKSFLKTSIYSNNLDKFLIFLFFIGILLLFFGFLLGNLIINFLAIFLAVLTVIAIFITAFHVYRKNFEPSKYFLIAWIFFLIGSIVSLFRHLGIANAPLYSSYSLEFASIFQIIILSYALTAKVNIIKRENQEAISRTVLYQEQANAELEQKVKERTIELNKYLSSIEKDLKMARNIQMNILPKNIDKIVNFNVVTYYQPLDEVGGDFYDIYQMSSTKLRILIADTTGHGVQASMVTMTIKSEYDSLKVFLSDPGELIDELQKRFLEIYKNMKIYFSAFIIDIDLNEEMISYASAGHPNQYLIQKGKIIELIRSGHIIGMLSNKQCTTKRMPYSKKDKIFLFTDGLYEEFNSLNEQFGEEKLIRVIEENKNLGMNGLVDITLEALEHHLKNIRKQDDITIIGIEEKIKE
jgi:two-component system, sensor histidine kinase LadS